MMLSNKVAARGKGQERAARVNERFVSAPLTEGEGEPPTSFSRVAGESRGMGGIQPSPPLPPLP